MKSNGWTDETAALQLFAHLNGEALNAALLIPEGESANREGPLVAPRKGGGGGYSQDAPLELMSSLIVRLLRAAQEDNAAEVPQDVGARRPSVVPEVEQVMVCFSCGSPGHGVNRCSQVDTSFPFLPHGWSVDV